jgi:tetratricopeptide (TPR) repeat protein
MVADLIKNNPELEALFHKYESAPDSYVFAPLADAYRKAGMLDEAVEICRKGLRKHPEYPSGHVVEGKCHFDVGMLDDAEVSFGKVLKLDQNNLVALKFLGMIQAGRGRLDKAGEYFKHILALDPENREIKGMLDDIREVEQPSAADRSKTADEPAADDDDFEGEPIQLGGTDELSDDLATTTLADIYAAQGFVQKAVRIYREVLRSHPGNADVRRKLKALESDVETDGGDREARADTDAGPAAIELTAAPADDDDYGNVALEATVDETVMDEEPQPVEQAVRAKAGASDELTLGGEKSAGVRLDEKKSYDQFKRWLENMK